MEVKLKRGFRAGRDTAQSKGVQCWSLWDPEAQGHSAVTGKVWVSTAVCPVTATSHQASACGEKARDNLLPKSVHPWQPMQRSSKGEFMWFWFSWSSLQLDAP